MIAEIDEVLLGKSKYTLVTADSLEVLRDMPPGSVDLIFGSCPYEDVRTYGIGFALKGEAWVKWMVEFFELAIPVTRGLVAIVVGHGKTRRHRWSAVPSLLEADLHRKGHMLRCPGLYERSGIPGSGANDYFRYDYEWIVTCQNPAFANSRGKLPWSNNRAVGHAPKWAPGGDCSHRMSDGSRRNQWGGTKEGGGTRKRSGKREATKVKPSHVEMTNRQVSEQDYESPAIANPGIVHQQTYTAEEVEAIIAQYELGIMTHCTVGGGHLGSKKAHDNEAPFSRTLADRYVLSFCPPGGVTLDPFSGSGTTVESAYENRRRGIGIDLRPSQTELARARLANITPLLVVEADERTKQQRVDAKEAKKAKVAHRKESKTPGLFDCLAGDSAGD